MTAALGRAALDTVRFPRETLDALFAAVLVDDEVDAAPRLPDAVQLDHSQDALVACFRLARQLWIDGFDRDALLGLTARLLRDRDLAPEDRVRFKHVRAKLKHVRYAHALYGAGHRYPLLLDQLATVMGQVQDAYRNGWPRAVAGRAALLRLLLVAPLARRLRVEGDRLVPASPASFRALLEDDYATLGALAARATVTGPAFHAARKLVGRQVSFWDTLRTLQPSEERTRVSRWLSAINGRMGEEHDRLVARRGGYDAPFPLPGDIRERIDALARRVRDQPAAARRR